MATLKRSKCETTFRLSSFRSTGYFPRQSSGIFIVTRHIIRQKSRCKLLKMLNFDDLSALARKNHSDIGNYCDACGLERRKAPRLLFYTVGPLSASSIITIKSIFLTKYRKVLTPDGRRNRFCKRSIYYYDERTESMGYNAKVFDRCLCFVRQTK